jgi:hypothetical protein
MIGWDSILWLLSQPWTVPASSLVLTGVIGLGTLTIGYGQHRTAKNKLRLDLFEKRLPVYEAAMTLASTIMSKGDVSFEEIQEFAVASRSVRFSFNQKLQDYCDELCNTARLVWGGKQKIDVLAPGEERDKSLDLWRDRVLWFDKQLWSNPSRIREIAHRAPFNRYTKVLICASGSDDRVPS